jgi:hypothetical protein
MPYSIPYQSTPTAGIVGKGTILGYSTTAGGAVTSIAEMHECDLPELNGGKVDATHYLSTGSAEENIPNGWTSVSDISCSLTYIATQHLTLSSLVNVPKYFTATLPDGSQFKFYGWLTKLGGGKIDKKGEITSPATICVSGVMTYAVYSGS